MIEGPVRFASFIVFYRLGTGGMGEVYRAVKIGPGGFEKDVALKLIHPDFSGDSEFRRLFLREARIAAKIQHPNVVSVFELGMAKGTLYMCMELVKGVTLKRLLNVLTERGERLSAEEVAYILHASAQGLFAAHSFEDTTGEISKIVHRDVSPQNIFVSYSGEVKIADFGVAKVFGYSEVTRTGSIKGKLSYMAPEQLRGEEVDERSDLYSLGIVALEMITGRKTFPVVEITKGEVERQLDETQMEEAGDFAEIIGNLIQDDRNKRLKNAEELAQKLASRFDIVKGKRELKERLDTLFSSERREREIKEREILKSHVFRKLKEEILQKEGGERTLVQGRKSGKGTLHIIAGFFSAAAVAGFIVGFTHQLMKKEEQVRRERAGERVITPENSVKKENASGVSLRGNVKQTTPARKRSIFLKKKKKTAERGRKAYISVFSEIDGYVFIDGKNTGRRTPLKNYPVSPGIHTVVVVHPERGLVGMERAHFKRGKEHVIQFRITIEKKH